MNSTSKEGGREMRTKELKYMVVEKKDTEGILALLYLPLSFSLSLSTYLFDIY